MYLLDSSAIAILLKRFGRGALKYIEGVRTLDLARYELGNIVWKECVLKTSVSLREAVSKAKYVAKLLKTMKVGSICSDEDFEVVMELAIKLKLTFYDASYLYVARREGLTLVTEDTELKEKSRGIGIKAISVSEYVKERTES